MTREEAIILLNATKQMSCNEKGEPISDLYFALDMAIQALESIDKIRAEIEQTAYPIVHGVNNHELGMTLYGILQIIDKYKAESEGKE